MVDTHAGSDLASHGRTTEGTDDGPTTSALVEVEGYESLDALTHAADIVVVGRITAVEPGREFGDPGETHMHYAAATVHVVEALGRGGSDELGEITWEIPMPIGESAAEVRAIGDEIPPDTVVLFLRNKATDVLLGRGDGDPHVESGFYRTVVGGAVLVNAGGAVALPVLPNESSFLPALVGQDFWTVLERIRAARSAGA